MATTFQTLSRLEFRNQGNRGDFNLSFSVAAGDSVIVPVPPGVEPTVSVVPAAGGTATVEATNSPPSAVEGETASYHAWTPGDIVNPATEMQSIYGTVTAVKISAAGGAVVATVTG